MSRCSCPSVMPNSSAAIGPCTVLICIRVATADRLWFQDQSIERSLFFRLWLCPGPLEASLRWTWHVVPAGWCGTRFSLALATCRSLRACGLPVSMRMRDKRISIFGDFRPELRVFALCRARSFQHAPIGEAGDVPFLCWPALKTLCACLAACRTFLERVEAFIIALELFLFAWSRIVPARSARLIWRAAGRWTLASPIVVG